MTHSKYYKVSSVDSIKNKVLRIIYVLNKTEVRFYFDSVFNEKIIKILKLKKSEISIMDTVYFPVFAENKLLTLKSSNLRTRNFKGEKALTGKITRGFSKTIYKCRNCGKILGRCRIYCDVKCRNANKKQHIIIHKKKAGVERIEALIKRLDEAEQEELTAINEELKELINNASYYNLQCVRCNKEIDVVENWQYKNRTWLLIGTHELNTTVDPRHHVIPRKYGGTDDEINKIILCFKCHDIVEIQTEDYIEKYKHYDIETLKSLIINDGFDEINNLL